MLFYKIKITFQAKSLIKWKLIDMMKILLIIFINWRFSSYLKDLNYNNMQIKWLSLVIPLTFSPLVFFLIEIVKS